MQLLNNGYEIEANRNKIDFAGFLYMSGQSYVEISDVTFEKNLAYTKTGSTKSNLGVMLSFKNILELRITDCAFQYNIITSALISVESSMTIPDKNDGAGVGLY